MAIQGLRTTANFVTDQRPKNWREGVLLLYPNGKAPLFALTSLMKKRVVDDPEFNWWEKELDDRRFALGANLTTTNTSVTLASGETGKTLKEGDLLYVEETGEIMLVDRDPTSDTSITVVRGYAGTTATAVTYNGAGVNPNLKLIGSAYEESSLAPTGISFDPTKQFNFTQIFRDTLEVSRTAQKTRLRTGDQVREAKRETLEYHSIGIEMAMWFGKRVETTKNGRPLRVMNGIFQQIPAANTVTMTSAYTSGIKFENLETELEKAFRFGSSEKVGFCGNIALLTIQRVVRNAKGVAWNIQSDTKEFGMNVTRITSPFGSLVLKSHPLWNQMTGGTTGTSDYYGVNSWLAILDMENIKYVHLKDSDTQYQPDLQANGLDGMKSGYLTECSIELHHAKTHYLMKNVVAYKAE